MAVIHYCFYCFKRIQMYQGIHRILSENALSQPVLKCPFSLLINCNMREIFSIFSLHFTHRVYMCIY